MGVKSLREFIKMHGYEIEEWDKTVGELCAKGVAKGCYQDYNLLQLVISWLCNYDGVKYEEPENHN